MSIYRRIATTVSDRSTFNILEYKDLGPPTVQNITSADLFSAINSNVLQPRNTTDTVSEFVLSQAYTTANLIRMSHLYQYDNTGSTMVNVLRNLLTVPLYVFNNMTSLVPTSYNIYALDLPKENFIEGRCATSQREVPQMWTVWVYIGTRCGILLLILGTHAFAMRWEVPTRSAFPLFEFAELVDIHDGLTQEGGVEGGNGSAGELKKTDSESFLASTQLVKVKRE